MQGEGVVCKLVHLFTKFERRKRDLCPFIVLPSLTVQGCTKRWTPGSVNMTRKNCVLLPAAGRRAQLFHLIFTEPGVHLLVHPCRLFTLESFQNMPDLLPIPQSTEMLHFNSLWIEILHWNCYCLSRGASSRIS